MRIQNSAGLSEAEIQKLLTMRKSMLKRIKSARAWRKRLVMQKH